MTHNLLHQEGVVRHLPLCADAVMNTVLRDTQPGRQEVHRSTTGFEGTTRILSIFRERIYSVDTKYLIIGRSNRVAMIKSRNSPQKLTGDGTLRA